MGTMEITRYLARHGAGRVARVAYLGVMTPFLAKSEDNPGGLDPDFPHATIRALKEDAGAARRCRRLRAHRPVVR
jgi:hypothetical protein